jgi:hypothetical protein
VTTENNEEQARNRAQKFRAFKEQVDGDLQSAEDKAERAQAKLAEKQGKFDEVQAMLKQKAKRFEEVEDRYGKCRERAEEARAALSAFEKEHKLSLVFVSEFRVAMQALPQKFGDSEQHNHSVFYFWTQNIQRSREAVRIFTKTLELASGSAAPPIHLINGNLIPSLQMMIRFAANDATRSQAIENGIKKYEAFKPNLVRDDGPPAAKKARIADGPSDGSTQVTSSVAIPPSLTGTKGPLQGAPQAKIQIPDDDEPLW